MGAPCYLSGFNKYTVNYMFSSSEIYLEDRVEKKPFRRYFTLYSDCVRNKRQRRGVFFITRIINTSIGILCCGYGHYSVLRAIISGAIPWMWEGAAFFRYLQRS